MSDELTKEEKEILERMKKDSAGLRKALPTPDGKGKPGKMTSFAPGIDDQGEPFPVRTLTPPPPAPKKP